LTTTPELSRHFRAKSKPRFKIKKNTENMIKLFWDNQIFIVFVGFFFSRKYPHKKNQKQFFDKMRRLCGNFPKIPSMLFSGLFFAKTGEEFPKKSPQKKAQKGKKKTPGFLKFQHSKFGQKQTNSGQ
jgi:hypothetical protein